MTESKQSYSARIAERAWSLTKADFGFEEIRPVAAKFVWTAVSLGIFWVTGAIDQLISSIGGIGASMIGLALVLSIFFLVNVPRAAAQLQGEADAEIAALRRQIDDEEARQSAINILWDLRSNGISLRNEKLEAPEDVSVWKERYETWRTRVLEEAGKANRNLQNYLSRLDRMGEGPPDILARAVSGDHRHTVRIMSEMLQRLQQFLTKELL